MQIKTDSVCEYITSTSFAVSNLLSWVTSEMTYKACLHDMNAYTIPYWRYICLHGYLQTWDGNHGYPPKMELTAVMNPPASRTIIHDCIVEGYTINPPPRPHNYNPFAQPLFSMVKLLTTGLPLPHGQREAERKKWEGEWGREDVEEREIERGRERESAAQTAVEIENCWKNDS